MENNTANVSEETVIEETLQPQLPLTAEGNSQISQRPVSESQQLQSPAAEETISHTSQRSEGVQTTNSTVNNTVESASTASSMPDPLAGGDNPHQVMECLREIIQCPVCFTVPFGMRIFCCRNGHSCCRQCLNHFRNITRTLLRRPFCPICRTSMVRRKVFRNFVAEQIVAEYFAILNENGETI